MSHAELHQPHIDVNELKGCGATADEIAKPFHLKRSDVVRVLEHAVRGLHRPAPTIQEHD